MPFKGGYKPSGIVHWNTPETVLRKVRACFPGGRIGLDPCSNQWSTVGAEKEVRLPDDGLKSTWESDAGSIFVNPPFGAGMPEWIRRCRDACRYGEQDVILLIPCFCETAIWHEVIFPEATALAFVASRVVYGLMGMIPEAAPPVGSVLILFAHRGETLAMFLKEMAPPFAYPIILRAPSSFRPASFVSESAVPCSVGRIHRSPCRCGDVDLGMQVVKTVGAIRHRLNVCEPMHRYDEGGGES